MTDRNIQRANYLAEVEQVDSWLLQDIDINGTKQQVMSRCIWEVLTVQIREAADRWAREGRGGRRIERRAPHDLPLAADIPKQSAMWHNGARIDQ